MILLALLLAACSGEVSGLPEKRNVPDSNKDQGAALIARYGCGSCHQIAGIPGATSQVAPPLTSYHQRSYIAGNLPNNTDNLIRWIVDPQAIEPGTAMPDLGVTPEEARHITAYLYNQPSTVFNR